jgi:hypothetical protein
MTHQSPERLVLLHRPVLLCAVLCAGTLALLAVGMWNMAQGDWAKAALALLSALGVAGPAIWFAAERVDVVFDANKDRVTISTRRLSGAQHETHPLQRVQRAMVQTHIGQSDSARAHRVALVMDPGKAEDRLPLTMGYASGRGATDLVDRINGWLDSARSDRCA